MIYNEFGHIVRSSKPFIKAARPSIGVPSTPPANRDISELIPPQDHVSLLSTSRALYANDGIVKGAIDQKSSYVIGRGYDPKFIGQDKEWGILATDFLRKWYRRCNVKGDAFDFKRSLELSCKSIDRDGDAFTLLTQAKSGYPMIQLISASRIATRDSDETHVQYGRYKGLKIINGAIINANGRVVAWRVLGDDPDGRKDQDISARRLLHAMAPDYYDQHRGLPIFSHALDDFKRLINSSEMEQHAMQINSAIALIESNPDGAAEDGNLYGGGGCATPTSEGIQMEQVQSGQIKYLQAGTGSKIETLTNDRPSANYQNFHDRLIRKAIIGIKWSYNLLVNFDGKSVADRSELAKAKKEVEARQDLMTPYAHKQVVYALSRAIELELLPPSEDFDKWSYSRGKSLSIDFGRDAKTQIALYDKGIENLTELVEENGRTLEEHLTESYTEEALSIQIKEKVEEKFGVQIDSRRVRQLTPNDTPENAAQ